MTTQSRVVRGTQRPQVNVYFYQKPLIPRKDELGRQSRRELSNKRVVKTSRSNSPK